MLNLGMLIDGPWIPSYEGATRRFVALPRHLCAMGAEVTIFHCFRGWSDMQRIAEEPFRTYFIPPRVFYRDPSSLATLLRRHSVAAALMSTAETILSLGRSLKTRLPELRLYLEAHDVGTDFLRSLGRPEAEIERMLHAERTAWGVCDLIVCFTERDRERILSLALQPAEALVAEGSAAEGNVSGEERVVVLPFGCDFIRYARLGPSPESKTVLFLGNLFHAPNARAVEFLADRVAPTVIAADPGVRFVIAGDAPTPLLERHAHSPLTILGKVDDLGSLFGRTSLAVAPIFHGSGIKIKVLDYAMAALPVLCTSQAITGIALTPEDAAAFAIEDDPKKYSDRILQLLGTPERLKELGQAAYRLARGHDWANIAGRTLEVLERYQTCPVRAVAGTPDESDGEPPLVPYYLQDNISQHRYPGNPEGPLDHVLYGGWGKIGCVDDLAVP